MKAIGNKAHTYVDRTEEPAPNGEPRFPNFLLCFQQQESINTEQFRQYLVEQVAGAWSQRSTVLRLRLHLLEPYSDKDNSPRVSHEWAKEKRYQAWMELIVKDKAALKSLLSNNKPAELRAIHTFPITAYYPLVYAGKLTDVGLRGFPAVRTIIQAGADNQRQPDLLKALYGSAAQ